MTSLHIYENSISLYLKNQYTPFQKKGSMTNTHIVFYSYFKCTAGSLTMVG